jgi:diaminohydroxyphosphoribosylaminopyrimidine deaminase/5-amino-6-(5-phosphoribosylamino)uracil reductase
LILEKKLTHVVIGSLDPNPIENGDGVKMLKQAGIQVTLGVLEAENRELNRAYFERFQ